MTTLAAISASGQGAPATVVRPDPSSGRLVRRVVVPPRTVAPTVIAPKVVGPGESIAAAPGSAKAAAVKEIVEDAARQHGVDPLLVHSVIQVESNYNPYAISSKGAEGLMQLIPATARRFGAANSFDPKQNIEAGVKYLRYLQDLFKDDRKALAAYNAGEGAVLRHNWIPPYPETMQYVYRVGKKYGEARRAAESQKSAAQAEGPTAPPKIVESVDAEGRVHYRQY